MAVWQVNLLFISSKCTFISSQDVCWAVNPIMLPVQHHCRCFKKLQCLTVVVQNILLFSLQLNLKLYILCFTQELHVWLCWLLSFFDSVLIRAKKSAPSFFVALPDSCTHHESSCTSPHSAGHGRCLLNLTC